MKQDRSVKSLIFGILLGVLTLTISTIYAQSGTESENNVIPRHFTSIEMGVNKGMGDHEIAGKTFKNSGVNFSGSFVNSFRIHKMMSVGFGIGFENYSEGTKLPVFADFRAYFGKKQYSGPFFIADAGYTFGWIREENRNEWGGLMVNPALGIFIPSTMPVDIFLSAGYKLQRTKLMRGFNVHYVNAEYITFKICLILDSGSE